MLEWISSWPDWLQGIWFTYITFHDFLQWTVMLFLARTAWGQRKKKKELEKILDHVHTELHEHIAQDAKFHEDLGQTGMSRGK